MSFPEAKTGWPRPQATLRPGTFSETASLLQATSKETAPFSALCAVHVPTLRPGDEGCLDHVDPAWADPPLTQLEASGCCPSCRGVSRPPRAPQPGLRVPLSSHKQLSPTMATRLPAPPLKPCPFNRAERRKYLVTVFHEVRQGILSLGELRVCIPCTENLTCVITDTRPHFPSGRRNTAFLIQR